VSFLRAQLRIDLRLFSHLGSAMKEKVPDDFVRGLMSAAWFRVLGAGASLGRV